MDNAVVQVFRRNHYDIALIAVVAISSVALTSIAILRGVVPIAGAILGLALFVLAVVKVEYAIIVWLGATVMIPEWTRIGPTEPVTAAAIPVVTGMLVSFVLAREKRLPELSWADLALIFGVTAILVQFVQGWVPGFAARDAVLVWLVGYMFGRRSTPIVQKAFVILMVLVAIWGLVEFAFDMHIFETWRPAAWHSWNAIQERAGFARSEATFGHAIAYGASIAMAIPFAQRMRFGVAIQIVLAAGVLVSLSRGPLLATVITLVLTTVLMSRRGFRFWSMVPLLFGAYLVIQALSFVYSNSTTGDIDKSSNARAVQFGRYFDATNLFTPSLTEEGYGLIDSTPLRLAVNFGIVIAVLLMAPVLLALWNLFTVRQAPASIALAGQIAVLSVTSLILQWAVLIFFMMGMAVSERTAAQREIGYKSSAEPQ